ncbi:MAG: mechanosensitive ion channel family protein [Kofleriaceae bacterium]
MVRAHADELFWVLGLFVAVVITAALVNRFRPIQRPRLRRLVTIFAIYVAATGAGIGFHAAGLPAWSSGCLVTAQIFQAFTLVSLSATLVIAIALPAIGVDLPMIASDLLVGLGYVVVTLAILARHGVNPTGALVSGAVVSAVLAISLQSTLGNIVGGVALQLDGSIREGDWIQLENGKQGKVRSVRWRHTVIEARDWSTIIVPNAQLLGNNITILGKREGKNVPQRMTVGFNIDFRFPPGRVIRAVTDALHGAAIENVADEPPPQVVCNDFAKDAKDSLASYAVRYWIRDLTSDESTSSRVRARIYTALQRAQIALPSSPFAELKDSVRAQWSDAASDRPAEPGGALARRQGRQTERIDQRLIALKTVQLFRSLTDDELRTLAAGLSHVMYTTGEVITRQGAAGNWLYVITLGNAEIRANVEGPGTPPAVSAPGGGRGLIDGSDPADPRDKVVVAKITAPDFFGEMSLMTGEPRSADVVAVGDVDCFRLGKETFETVLLARPEIATELSDKLASRRVELIAAREGLDAGSKRDRQASERDRILRGIRTFFALG